MYDPDSYDAYSAFQRRDARELVPYMVSKMGWHPNQKILDFGCGSGYNTANILLPSLEISTPRTTKHLKRALSLCLDENNNHRATSNMHIYGVDISKKMIDFASIKYVDQRITYMVADVLKEECEFPCKFDKIFSFHVLHWIKDQEKALGQLYNLLNCGGELGMFYISTGAVFSVYEIMSKLPIFEPFLSDVQNFIPKSHHSPDPAKDVADSLSSIGYLVQETRNCVRKFTFPSVDVLIEAAMAANPFIHRIPEHLQSEYKKQFRNVFLPFIANSPTPSNPDAVQVDYEIVLLRAKRID